MSLLPPPYQDEKNSKSANGGGHTVGRRTTKALKRVLVGSLAVVGGLHIAGLSSGNKGAEAVAPLDASILSAGLAYCDALYAPKPCFGHRLSLANERADPDEPAYLLRNATIYTANGEIIEGGDILIQDGLIKKVARKSGTISVGKEVEVIDVGRAWVTPGIVDLHSHMGVYAAPSLSGNADGNSIKSPILPYLRSIDGFSTADLAFANSIAGGITSMQVLPGSANNVGGEAFFFKPRHIKGGSPSDMALEPAFVFNGNGTTRVGGRNRRSKHAQGENIMRVHSSTRMDQGHWFRQAYEAGRKQMVKEDVWCAKGKDNTEPFPTDLDNEMLADTIRGNVKVNVHSYQTVDFDLMARLTNEFKFHVSAIHHAHEAYLVPDLLKKYYGGAPAVAGFAVTARYKWESMRGSEFASSILAEAGITNIMKSDHPVLDSRYLMWEAAQAHHYGLNWTLAMDAVFSAPARTAGLDHRIGFAVEGHDADLVIWDSMPLSLGATPAQVFIDGVKQLKHPHVVAKPDRQDVPRSRPDSHQRAKETRETGGNLSYAPRKTLQDVVFINVRSAFGIAHDGEVEQTFGASYESADWANVAAPLGSVVVRGSEIVCSGACDSFAKGIADVVDLAGGSVLPGLVGYGPALGVSEIAPEKSTVDGNVFDLIAPAVGVPDILKGTIIKGSEALSLGGKELQIIHHAGILTAFAHPTGNGLVSGLSSAFRTGAENVLSSGAIVAEVGALHSALAHGAAAGSISEQIRALKLLLLGGAVKDSEAASYFAKVAKGEVPLVVAANKADHIAGLINMKRAVDKASGSKLKLVIEGGLEAHLLVDELAKEEISVIVPPRSYPGTWDTQRIIAGPPLTEHTLASLLTSKGVIVGIGHGTNDVVRQARFDALWNYSAVPSVFSPASAIALVSANLYKMLGVKAKAGLGGFIAVEGDVLNMGSRVVAALDNGHIELF